MDIKFYCTHCGQHISIDTNGAGMTVACPKCSQSLVVPSDCVAVRVPGARAELWGWIFFAIGIVGASSTLWGVISATHNQPSASTVVLLGFGGLVFFAALIVSLILSIVTLVKRRILRGIILLSANLVIWALVIIGNLRDDRSDQTTQRTTAAAAEGK